MFSKVNSNDDVLKEVGARLTLVRGESRLTQDAFSKSIGLSARAYHYYERGQRSMPVQALVQVSELYEVDLNWLIRGLDKGELADVSGEIEQFATELYEYLESGEIKVPAASFGAIVSRWYSATRMGKKISNEDVQIWVDLLRTN